MLAGLLAGETVFALLYLALAGSPAGVGVLLAAPLIAAALATPRTVVIVSTYAIAWMIALGFTNDFWNQNHVVRTLVFGLVCAAAVWLALIRERLEKARNRYSLIADAGVVMSGALDFEVSLIELARLCARRLADWCFVFVLEEDGSIRQVAAAHVDAERQRLAWDLLRRYPLDPGRPEGPAKVVRTGRPDLQPHVDDDLLRAIAADDENLRLLKALELRSAMIAPLIARGRILGAIAFASAESGRVFDRHDLEMAEELSSRAAMTLDNARLYVRASSAEKDVRRQREQLQGILGGVADAVTAQDADGHVVYANDAAAELMGLRTADELMALDPREIARRVQMLDEDGRPFDFDRLPGRRALRGETPEPQLLRYRLEGGEERWSIVKSNAVRDEAGRPILAINVVEDVTEQRQREQRQGLLADAGKALGASLDWEETFPEVARIAARALADWCSIELLDPDGSIRMVAIGHADGTRDGFAERMLTRYGSAKAPRGFLRVVLSEGRPVLHPEISDEELAAAARDPEHLGLLLNLGVRSLLSVPMVVRGTVVGALTLTTVESGRRLTEDDLWVSEELAGRCALAFDNAHLYRERSTIARTLQESLLPPMLPEMPGIDVAARFRAAGRGIDVGGDFYDLFEVGDAGWGVAIGDVCGKGTGAAAVTALARYTVRAAAMRQDGPSQILALLNEALLRQRTDRRFCTVLYGRVAQNGRGVRFDFASGGHPLPLVVRAGKAGAEVGAPGTLLGIVPDPRLNDAAVHLSPGDTVVLYTDGVTDAAAPDRIWSADDVAAAIGPTRGTLADEIAERVLAAVLAGTPGEPRDDIAILVLKVPESV